MPRPPRWLGAHGRDLWRRLAPGLQAKGRLRPEFLPAFTGLCAVYHRARSAEELLEREGLTTTTARGLIRPHPAVRILAAAERDLLAWMRDFGLTVASDARIPAPVTGGRRGLRELLLGPGDGGTAS